MLESQELLRKGMATRSARRPSMGITVNEDVLAHVHRDHGGHRHGPVPVLGYDKATELADEAYKSGKGLSR